MCEYNPHIMDCNDCQPFIIDGVCPIEEEPNTCGRTGRLCVGGAFDDGDGWGIDCPSASPDNCPHKQ